MPFLYEFQEPADFTNVLCKFWLTDEFWCGKLSIPFSTIFSYLHQVDVKTLDFCKHTFSFNEFVFLASNVEKITLCHVTVKNEDGTIVPLEKIVKVLPKIKEFEFSDNPVFSSFTANTVKELLEIPHLRTIDKFQLFNITEKFDIKTFFTYLKVIIL
uniref:Uncharacterized protein n=1 Tax=Panagrolaimus sp. PS1159 TaxID=55785 RepID=A0AC35FH69_9BILA